MQQPRLKCTYFFLLVSFLALFLLFSRSHLLHSLSSHENYFSFISSFFFFLISLRCISLSSFSFLVQQQIEQTIERCQPSSAPGQLTQHHKCT